MFGKKRDVCVARMALKVAEMESTQRNKAKLWCLFLSESKNSWRGPLMKVHCLTNQHFKDFPCKTIVNPLYFPLKIHAFSLIRRIPALWCSISSHSTSFWTLIKTSTRAWLYFFAYFPFLQLSEASEWRKRSQSGQTWSGSFWDFYFNQMCPQLTPAWKWGSCN